MHPISQKTAISGKTIRIIDEKKEELALQRQRCIDVISSALSIDQSNENIVLVCDLAASFYLEPHYVLLHVNYWLTHYTDYFLPEKDWFNDMIKNLLNESPKLKATSGEIVSSANKRHMRLQIMVRFIGTERFYIPLEYYTSNQYFALPCRLGLLFETGRRCFSSRTADSLDGNITLSAFNYDMIMAYFYEPSFMIISAYLFHLIALLKTTEGQVQSDYLPRHIYSLEAIKYDNIDWDKVCVHNENNNYALERLQQDLQRLYQILYVTNLEQAASNLQKLWEEKASGMKQMIHERKQIIYSRFISPDFSS